MSRTADRSRVGIRPLAADDHGHSPTRKRTSPRNRCSAALLRSRQAAFTTPRAKNMGRENAVGVGTAQKLPSALSARRLLPLERLPRVTRSAGKPSISCLLVGRGARAIRTWALATATATARSRTIGCNDSGISLRPQGDHEGSQPVALPVRRRSAKWQFRERNSARWRFHASSGRS